MKAFDIFGNAANKKVFEVILANQRAEGEHEKHTTKRLFGMHLMERNTLFIVLSAVIFAVMFVLEVRQAKMLSISTTVGLRHGSPLR
jgi:hypothetical protein